MDMIWVCLCCMLVHANGECCGRPEHGGDSKEPLNRVTGWNLALSDEEIPFTWNSCDGCGSTLGGTRYELAIFDK